MSSRSHPLWFVLSEMEGASLQGCSTAAKRFARQGGAIGGGVIFFCFFDCEATPASRACSKSIVLRAWSIDSLDSSCYTPQTCHSYRVKLALSQKLNTVARSDQEIPPFCVPLKTNCNNTTMTLKERLSQHKTHFCTPLGCTLLLLGLAVHVWCSTRAGRRQCCCTRQTQQGGRVSVCTAKETAVEGGRARYRMSLNYEDLPPDKPIPH